MVIFFQVLGILSIGFGVISILTLVGFFTGGGLIIDGIVLLAFSYLLKTVEINKKLLKKLLQLTDPTKYKDIISEIENTKQLTNDKEVTPELYNSEEERGEENDVHCALCNKIISGKKYYCSTCGKVFCYDCILSGSRCPECKSKLTT